MLLNIRKNDKTGFYSSTSVPFLISLSLYNLSTVGCWERKSISGFSRQCLESWVTPTLSNLLSFKSSKEMPTNLRSFMQASPLISSSPSHIFIFLFLTYQRCKAKNREPAMSKLQDDSNSRCKGKISLIENKQRNYKVNLGLQELGAYFLLIWTETLIPTLCKHTNSTQKHFAISEWNFT